MREWVTTGLQIRVHQRRCPNERPSLVACCRNAPTVLFIALEIALTGVLAREYSFNSRLSAVDHGLAFLRPSTFLRVFFAIALPSSMMRMECSTYIESALIQDK